MDSGGCMHVYIHECKNNGKERPWIWERLGEQKEVEREEEGLKWYKYSIFAWNSQKKIKINLKTRTSDLNRCFLKYLWMEIGTWNKKFNLTGHHRTKNKNQKATSPHLCDNSHRTHAYFWLFFICLLCPVYVDLFYLILLLLLRYLLVL